MLYPGSMLQDDSQLLSVSVEFFRRKRQACQVGNMGDIHIYGHNGRSLGKTIHGRTLPC